MPVTAAVLLIVVATGSYRRVERVAIVIGLFELAFFAVAWAAHPNLETLAKNAVDLPLYNRVFMFLVAAVIGAVFNPWMIFYQQAAIAVDEWRTIRSECLVRTSLTLSFKIVGVVRSYTAAEKST